MATSGIGQDGYLRYQKETTYNTAATSSMIDLPVKDGSLIKGFYQNIENANVVGSRVPQLPNKGRKSSPTASLVMDYYPDIVGGLLNVFLGAATTVDNTDGSYTHTWLPPISGSGIDGSATFQQAVGSDLVDQFTGGKIAAVVIDGDTTGNLQLTLEIISKDYTEDVARVSSFSVPSTIPFNWSFASIGLTPSGGSEDTPCVKSFNYRLDLGYDLENYCFNSDTINEPNYQTIPTGTLSLNMEADRDYLKNARDHVSYAIDMAFTSTEDAGTSNKYNLELELPAARINPEAEIPFTNDKLLMDLEFTLHGGTTTGSGTDSVISELRIIDQTSAYS